MRARSAGWVSATLGLMAAACAAAPVRVQAPTVQPIPQPPARVEKVREPLEVTPLELHFSGQRGATKTSESVSIKNDSTEPVPVSGIRIVGADANTFRVLDVPLLPMVLPPTSTVSFSVGFEPSVDAETGVHRARVRIIRTEEDDGPPCDLTGLVTKGETPSDEPSLHQALDALGYEVDVGSTTLNVPVTKAGDEIQTPRFARAKPGAIGIYLIARYTSEEASTFGTYVLGSGKPILKPLGSVAPGQNQTLNPELEDESQTSFDPGSAAFGLFLKVGKRTLYSEDSLNSRGRKHVGKVFPLRSRGRTPVHDAYVVAFDEDGSGDYQDHVFMLWNVKPDP